MKPNQLIFLILLTSMLFSCKKDEPVEVDLGYDYYPINKGHFVVYDIDSIVHVENALGGGTDTFRYQIKEIIDSIFNDDEGRDSERISRYIRNNSSEPWRIKDIWYSTRTERRVERIEENIRYMKLSFPVKEGNSWNGNAFNILPEEKYEYTAVDELAIINENSFSEVTTVLQKEVSNLIEQQYALEKYAKGVGLVFKQKDSLDLQSGGGLEYLMKVASYQN